MGAGAAQAATWTETAIAGPVTATLTTTYSNSYDNVLDAEDMTLTITRSDGGAGATYSGAAFAPWGPTGDFVEKTGALHLVDLDRNGDPEAVVDVFSGGAHCCFVSFIATRPPRTPAAYSLITAYWGNWATRRVDLNRDGVTEFAGFDDRFAYTFGAYIDSVLPPRVWNLRDGRLQVTTGRYHARAVVWMRRDWRTYLMARRLHRPVAGALAAYLASASVVGRGASRGAWQRAVRLHPGPGGERMLRNIQLHLVKWGVPVCCHADTSCNQKVAVTCQRCAWRGRRG
jgi:hypothetical protein